MRSENLKKYDIWQKNIILNIERNEEIEKNNSTYIDYTNNMR